ncbi:hypothetical protein CR513_39037, partial [Mucuna pruriens]
MKEEMKVIEKNSTWEIVDRLKDKRAIGYKWIYIMKCKSDRTIDRYKARPKRRSLHGDLEEEVYMEIPLGFYSPNGKNKVYKLKKALYGLKSVFEHDLKDLLKS